MRRLMEPATVDSFSARVDRKPACRTRSACCARGASGHAAAVLPRNDMNSRRLITSPRLEHEYIVAGLGASLHGSNPDALMSALGH